MKKLIRLTESDLHRIVKESVNRVISERIAGEHGMTDDEVMRRRNDNFMRDMDRRQNSIHNDPYTPNYSDRMEMEAPYHTPEEMDNIIANDRRVRHGLRQNVSRGLKSGMRNTFK